MILTIMITNIILIMNYDVIISIIIIIINTTNNTNNSMCACRNQHARRVRQARQVLSTTICNIY